MKLAGLISLLLFLFVVPSKNQVNDKAAEKKEQTPVIISLPSSKSLSAAQLQGKKLFLERCSVCHLPGMASYSAYGPLLDRKNVASLGEATVRDLVMQGSARMPGFQYTLKAYEIDEIVQFLKIVDLAKN
jgi:mono/diheme cytochrome c family protein